MSVPAPPPPPPFLSPKQRDCQAEEYTKEPLDVQEELRYLLQPLQQSDSDPGRAAVTFVQTIHPVIQNGPMCGLVALTMASEILYGGIRPTAHPELLLQMAKACGFTKQGEMFSVDYMLQTAEKQLQCEGRVTSFQSLTWSALVQALLGGEAVLVPYDADKDHSPCLAKGHKAHWCLLVGFALLLTEDVVNLLDCCVPVSAVSRHYSVGADANTAFIDNINSLPTVEQHSFLDQLYIFARHGKSRHLGLWKYTELLKSNANLVAVGPQRIPGEYVIPEGGIAEELCSKIVVLSKHHL